jgi:hyperosmotically inducible protein
MKKIHGLTGLVLVVFLGTGYALRAQQEGLAGKAAEKLDQFGRAVRRGVENAGETVREGFARTRDMVQGMGVAARVYSRIHWDKTLHASNLTLRADGGAVTLRGMVPDEAARKKAIALTADTFGVTRVIDQLTVPVPSEAPVPSTR